MNTIPKHVTTCYTCEQHEVGVVEDVGLNVGSPRWRVARHRVKKLDRASPICAGSRVVVPDAIVFLNEEWLQRHRVDADA